MKASQAQFPGIGYTKGTINQARESLYRASSKSLAHNSRITITEMTPEEYRNGGEDLTIHYGFAESRFGSIVIASTEKGVCSLAFYDGTREEAFQETKKHFPNATYHEQPGDIQQNAMALFTGDWSRLGKIKLHVKGTPFRLKVWEALLRIPMGERSTYSAIAESVHHPKASRAVGSAVGDNPVAFLIPCHRVIKSTGEFGQYHWGSDRKKNMIGWETNGMSIN